MKHWSTYRKSIRSYQDEPLSGQFFQSLHLNMSEVTPLFQDEPFEVRVCQTMADFLPHVKNGIIGKFGLVKGPHYLLLSSHDTPRGKMNLGYVGEQIVKYLTEENCGTCWLGGPSLQVDHPEDSGFNLTEKMYNIAIVFGTPESGKVSYVEKRTRKKVEQVCPEYHRLPQPIQDAVDTLVSAPTAMNHQGWKLDMQSSNNGIHQFSYSFDGVGMVKRKLIDTMIPLDLGIGLFHLIDRAGEINTPISFSYEPKGSLVGIITLG